MIFHHYYNSNKTLMNTKKLFAYPSIAQSFGIFGIIVGMSIVSTPLVFLKSLIGKELAMLLYYLLAIGGSALIVLSKRKQKSAPVKLNWGIQNWVIIPLLVVATLSLVTGVISPVSDLIPMSESAKEMFRSMGEMKGVFGFLVMVVAAPVLEELICRGVLLDGLLRNYSPKKAIFYSALIFGLIHLNPWQFITAFLIGLFMGWVYYRTRSLLATIIIHFTVNFTGFVLNHFVDFETSFDTSYVELAGSVLNAILLISGAILIAAVSIFLLNREFAKQTAPVFEAQFDESVDDAIVQAELVE